MVGRGGPSDAAGQRRASCGRQAGAQLRADLPLMGGGSLCMRQHTISQFTVSCTFHLCKTISGVTRCLLMPGSPRPARCPLPPACRPHAAAPPAGSATAASGLAISLCSP